MIIPYFSDDTLPFFVKEIDEDDMEIEIFFDETNTESFDYILKQLMKSKVLHMRAQVFVFLICFTATLESVAQQLPSGKKEEPCSTMERDSISRLLHPERGTLEEFENALLRKMEVKRLERKAGRTMAVVSIPIIVHVVHNGEAVGTGTNLSLAQVQSQIDVLNEDFRKQAGTPGFNNSPVGADIEIEFCLSPVDENGNSMQEAGIDRINGNRADWTQDQIENQLKPSSIWNPNLFYNVWTVKFAATEVGLLGYAQFPDQTGLQGIPANSPASTDGVVCAYQTFGSSDKGNFPVLQAPLTKAEQ